MFSSIVAGPVHHTDGPGVIKSRHAVVALRESQTDSNHPNQGNYHLCSGGGESWLQGVNDGHIPARRL